MEMTGANMMRLLNAAKAAVDAAGVGEMRGYKLVMALYEQGVDCVLMDAAPAQQAGQTSLDLPSEE